MKKIKVEVKEVHAYLKKQNGKTTYSYPQPCAMVFMNGLIKNICMPVLTDYSETGIEILSKEEFDRHYSFEEIE